LLLNLYVHTIGREHLQKSAWPGFDPTPHRLEQ
jgi:hypothetical protein